MTVTMTDAAPDRNRVTELDSYDVAIVSALAENAEVSTIELSKQVHLSRTAVARRIANLRSRGIIGPARVEVQYEKLGFAIRALVEVSAPRQDSFATRDRLLERPEVLGLSVVLGENLIVADVLAVDTPHLHQFLTWLNDMGVSETKVVLKRHESNIPLRRRLPLIDEKRAERDPRLENAGAANPGFVNRFS